jgi:site-specific recombinase XerC
VKSAWHTLRHTFASRLLEREVAIMIVKELLGHSTITVTMRYTISNLDSKVAVVGKIVGSTVHQLSAVHPRCHNSPLTCRIR